MPAEPLLGQIMLVGFSFAPRGWAFCDGQVLAIAQNEALFALVGTTYGGDGQATFALPDLRSRVPIHQGNGPGLSNYSMGQVGGTESVTLTINEMPAHTHTLGEAAINSDSKSPVGAVVPGNVSGTNTNIYSTAATDSNMAPNIVATGGASQPHNNIQPFVTINYCIALEGIFPSRN